MVMDTETALDLGFAMICTSTDLKRYAMMIGLIAVAGAFLFPISATAVKVTSFAGTLRGFPALREINGKKLADGDFAQSLQDDRLHVKLIYRFTKNRQIEENAQFKQKPELIQESWSWREVNDGKLLRKFNVDFSAGRGTAEKEEKGQLKQWSEKLDIESGQTFAGIGFVLAIMNLRERLVAGESIELKAAAFTPKPRTVSVEISYAGLDQMRMADRSVKGDHFVIHPKIPRIAQVVIKAPDTHMWLTNPAPAGFLRTEGPLVEPSDAVIRIDLLAGGESGAAKPISDKSP